MFLYFKFKNFNLKNYLNQARFLKKLNQDSVKMRGVIFNIVQHSRKNIYEFGVRLSHHALTGVNIL